MLTARTLLDADGITLSDVRCRHARGRGEPGEQTAGNGLVFVRRGCFVRGGAHGEVVLDPTLGYCINAGDEDRYDHPHDGGDDCTSVFLAPALAAAVWGGDPRLPARPLRVDPVLDLAHRRLVAAARRGEERHALVEAAVALAAGALERVEPRRVASGRPATARAHRRLADGVREALAHDAARPLPELARSLGVAPHHLSRVFRRQAGHTIARHRMRLRTRAAIERLAAGERNLARLAADLGFADQSHLTRTLRAETGEVPRALRAALAPVRSRS